MKKIQLNPVQSINDISFGHVAMVEDIGRALADYGKKTAFSPIITATYDDNFNIVITIPNIDDRANTALINPDGRKTLKNSLK